MRIARVRYEGKTSTAVVKGRTAHLVKRTIFGSLEETGVSAPLSRVQLLVPVEPSKILAMGINYKSHLGERKGPSEPQPFFKTPSSLIAQGESIVLPPGATNVHPEAEIVAVIGRRAKNITEDQVDDHVFGYTCGNDVSGRDWQQGDLQWWRAKSSDTFSPLGPWIETSLKPDRIEVIGRINGNVQQQSDSTDMLYSIRECIAFISRHVTLERGDLVYTGTPGQTAPVNPGDVCEVEVKGIGVLKNPVAGA